MNQKLYVKESKFRHARLNASNKAILQPRSGAAGTPIDIQ